MKKFRLEFTLAAMVAVSIVISVFIAVNGMKKHDETNNFLEAREVIYGHDERTGLCFARVKHRNRTFVNIECTEKVLSIINGRDSDGTDE